MLNHNLTVNLVVILAMTLVRVSGKCLEMFFFRKDGKSFAEILLEGKGV